MLEGSERERESESRRASAAVSADADAGAEPNGPDPKNAIWAGSDSRRLFFFFLVIIQMIHELWPGV